MARHISIGLSLLTTISLLAATASGQSAPRTRPDYDPAPTPVRYLVTPAHRHPVAVFKMLVERSNFRDAVEIAELTQERGKVPPHVHRSDEVFHVLEGELVITVKRAGDDAFKEYHLLPGMTGTIAKGDWTTHEVVTDYLKAIVVWAPGGEADHMVRVGFKAIPYDEDAPNPYHELLRLRPKPAP